MKTRKRLLADARDLISKKGFRSTGLYDICRASNQVNSTFYYYFKNKEEMLNELLLESLEEDKLHQWATMDMMLFLTIEIQNLPKKAARLVVQYNTLITKDFNTGKDDYCKIMGEKVWNKFQNIKPAAIRNKKTKKSGK